MQDNKQIEEHRVSKVTHATIKKPGVVARVAKAFIEEDKQALEDKAVEVITDRLKDGALELFETMLFGSSKNRNSRKNSYDRASYATYYYNGYDNSPRRDMEDRRQAFDMSDVILDSYGEANEVLQNLVELIAKYGVARVGDFYDLVGISSRKGGYTCNNYGWFDVEGTVVRRARGGGYFLDLPRPVALD